MEGSNDNESECLVPIGVPNGSQLFVPKYFRFKPKDDELISDFLLRKSKSLPLDVDVIAEVDIYKFNPWELPKMTLYGEKDWYFFTRRKGKQPNMVRRNRLAGIGFWKATGPKKKIGHSKVQGIKKSLAFFTGKVPNATRTNWLMHEYSLLDVDRGSTAKGRKTSRVNEWVIVRVYQRNDKKVTPMFTFESPNLGLVDSEIAFGSPIQLMVDEIVPDNLVNEVDVVPAVLENMNESLALPLEPGLVDSEIGFDFPIESVMEEIIPYDFVSDLFNSFPLMPENFVEFVYAP
ncbi:NAC transcription factor 32-like [Impatiens glandulifera]|uniref:NAC transcription factor 32-like n=1 Tax=Impatiens glandulifera TaxID=253017 RepID=UPI001FB1081C|nr:NAC transcription factor 32-like [Impatiens glandulifera]